MHASLLLPLLLTCCPLRPQVFVYDKVPDTFAETPESYAEKQEYFPAAHIGKLATAADDDEFTWMYNEDFAI